MRSKHVLKRVILCLCVAHIVFMAIFAFHHFFKLVDNNETFKENYIFNEILYRKENPSEDESNLKKFENDFNIKENEAAIVLFKQDVDPKKNIIIRNKNKIINNKKKPVIIEIWGKAAIASYLWRDILEGTENIDTVIAGTVHGHLYLPKFILRYRSGPGLLPETVSHDVTRLVLVVNGRTPEKITEAQKWVDSLILWKSPPMIVLVMLGNEKCDNNWVDNYLKPSGIISAVLVTYDDPRVDGKTFHQWPLGVATYRQFPTLDEDRIEEERSRKFVCNYRATIYENSSRVHLQKILSEDSFASKYCDISIRNSWSPSETVETMNKYVNSLLQSDLTLCPAGKNVETYRAYEAMSAGSVPVIEDVQGLGHCDSRSWRLMKKLDPPVIWVKSWQELPKLLARERRYGKRYKILRRRKIFKWYEWFKLKIRDQFITIIMSSFHILGSIA